MTTETAAPAKKSAGKRAVPRSIRGYIHGIENAARHLDMDRRTFQQHVAPHVRPRILGKDSYWRIADLERFMDPDRNPPGAETEFRCKQ